MPNALKMLLSMSAGESKNFYFIFYYFLIYIHVCIKIHFWQNLRRGKKRINSLGFRTADPSPLTSRLVV